MNRFTAACSALLFTASAGAATLAGSDIAGPAVATALATSGTTTSFKGTYDALRDLRSGKADAALIFIRDGERIPEVVTGAWEAAAVAYQPVYVAVNSANKASEIDLSVLAGLYGKTNDIIFDTWRCLPSSGLSQSPLAIAPHPGKGLTVSHFRSEVLSGGEFRPTVRFASDDADAESRAVAIPNAIVVLSRPPVSGNLRLLAVADGRAGKPTRAYPPTASSLNSGDYPLRITLFVVFPKDKKAAAAPAVRALLSGETSKLLSAKGLVPTPENIRNKFTQSLDS